MLLSIAPLLLFGSQVQEEEAAILAELWPVLAEVSSLQREGDVDMAREWLRAVVDGPEYLRLLESEHEVVIAGLSRLEDAAGTLRDLETQRRLREEKVQRLSAHLDADDDPLLAAKTNLAVTCFELGDFEAALALEQDVHARHERMLPTDHPHLLLIKGNLARTCIRLGDFDRARGLLEHVHAIRASRLPADHPDLLSVEAALAVNRAQLGDFEGALALFERVHAAYEGLLSDDDPDLLDAKINLAVARRKLGDLEGARELLERVHAAYERLLPSDHQDLLVAKANLAVSHRGLGNLESALALEEYVHAASERRLPADHPDLLRAKANLAGTRLKLGDPEGAAALLTPVLAARRRMLAPDHPDLSAVHANMGLVQRKLGDPEGALELFELAHAARQRLLPADHPELLWVQTNLLLTRKQLGDLQGAREVARSMLSSLLARASALHTAAPRVARAGAQHELDRLRVGLFLADALADEGAPLEPSLFTALEALRLVSTTSAHVALALLRFPELDPLHERLARVRGELNDRSHSPPKEASALAAWREEILQLSGERDRVERELAGELADKGVFLRIPHVELVAAGLGEDSALISFLRYEAYLDADATRGDRSAREDLLVAFVVTPDAQVRRVDLGAARGIEELAAMWRASLGTPLMPSRNLASGSAPARGVVAQPSEGTSRHERVLGSELRRRLLDACFAALGEERPATLHLILDDFLHLLPIEALPWEDERRLGEGMEVRVEVSTRRLIQPPDPPDGQGTLVAVGGVDFDAVESEDSGAARAGSLTPPPGAVMDRRALPGRFEPLAHTAPEVQDLAQLYERRVAEEPIVLLGAAASKQALHDMAPRARFLHVATHGWFTPKTFRAGLVGADEPNDQDLVERVDRTLVDFAPETLCGLALAGANRGADERDGVLGIVTAEELATLDLSHCELAVLSACETNVGIRRAGQGIQSLQAALHAAGARSSITSLWRVDDAATRKLMERFYTNLWVEQMGKADALWQAKLALREAGHPVRDWAGWVLTGDPN